MGRGYSNSRSKSARPTLRMKRQRSLSVQNVKESSQLSPMASIMQQRAVARSAARFVGKKNVLVRGQTRERSGMANKRTTSGMRQQLVVEKEIEDTLESSEQISETIVKPDVMTKYKSAGRALDEVMDIVATASVPGVNTMRLCELGDVELLQRVQAMFSKAKDKDGKRILRGLSYPTNVSVNQTLCNHAPMKEEDAVILRGGDVVKIHMGCHIDGYPVSAARTIIVPADGTATSGSSSNDNVTGTPKPKHLTQGACNAVEAARVALLGMIHVLDPGTLNADMTEFIDCVESYYGVEGLEGVLSNRTKRWVPDGMDCIITRRVTLEDPHQDVPDCNVSANQVWTLDVAFTDHSSYKVIPVDGAATIFRRTEVEFQNDARVRSVHASLQEVTEKHQCFPFSLKHVQNPLKVRMAVAVLQKQGIIVPLPELRIKGDQHITARFSATVAVLDRRITVICGLPSVESIHVPYDIRPLPVPEDIVCLLTEPLTFTKESQ